MRTQVQFIRNVGLVGYSVTGINYVGGLVGYNAGTLTNDYATGSLVGEGNDGGLVGNNVGTISDSYTTGSVTGGALGIQSLGGLAGRNTGTISNSYSTAAVTPNGLSSDIVGGLVGFNFGGTISNSYATGAVTGMAGKAGGLAGYNSAGTISNSYATGVVTGGAGVTGGLLGSNGGTVTNSFWDTVTSGTTTGVGSLGSTGVTGLTTAQMQTQSSFTGWDFTNTWGMIAGVSYPWLRTFNLTAPTVVSGIAYQGAGDVRLASTSSGAAYVSALVDGHSIGQVTTGANGYYYFLLPAGTVASSGSQILAYTTTDALSGAANGATLAQNASASVSYLDVLGNYMGYQTSAANYAAAAPTLASAPGNLVTALGSNAISSWVNTLGRTAIISTAANFSVDAIPAGNYAVDAAAGNLTVTAPISVASGDSLNLLSSNKVSINAPITIAGSGGLILNVPFVSGIPMLGFSIAGRVQYTGAEGAGQFLNINGTDYTLLFTLLELQGLQNTLSGHYALAGNMDATATSGWNLGAGFVPIGSLSTPFTGTFDGLGNSISNLTINTPSNDYVGLFGYAGVGSFIRNVGLVGYSVTGINYVGALAGYNAGTLTNDYATGSLVGEGNDGGLVGNNVGTISDSYTTGSVTGGALGIQSLGGLAGRNTGTISNSYSTAAVTPNGLSSDIVGGLVGFNFGGTISNSYATGVVTGGAGVTGGLLGSNGGTVTNSFWDTVTSGTTTGVGSLGSTGVTGMTTAQMQTQSNFSGAGWDFANTWVMYDGHTSPLLRYFMTELTVTANNATKTYDRLAYSGSGGVSYSITPNSNLLGTVGYSSGTNAGSYAIAASGLYSNQQGYIISYVDGVLTVNTKAITVTGESAGNKVYDGTTAATLSGGSLGGVIAGDTVTLTEAGTFSSKNVGTGIAVTTADSIGGASASNYTLTQPTGLTANITKKTISVTGESAGNKVYDGTAAATLTGGSLSGVIAGDSVTLTQAGAFSSKNVGTGVAVTASDSLGSTDAGNYALTQTAGLTADITKKTISVSGESAGNKIYDGTMTATLSGGSLVGVIAGDSVTLTEMGAFSSKNVGTGVAVTASDSLSSTDAGNYALTQTSGLTANITPLAITVAATGTNKVYDATLNDSVTLASSGVISGDVVSFADSSATFANKNVGIGKTVSVSGISASGTDSGNYSLNNTTATTTANITQKTITVTGESAGNKVYDGTAAATLAGGSLSGVIAGDSVTLTEAGTFSSKNVGTGVAVTASDSLGSTDAGNYALTQTAGLTADITQKAITVTATGVDKIYDGNVNDAALLSSSGVVGGDSVTFADTSATFLNKNVGNAKTVSISGISASGADAGNYSLNNLTASTTASITPAFLSVIGESAGNKIYDGTTAATLTGGSLVGIIAGDSVTLTEAGAFASKNAGTNVSVIASNSLGSTDAGNYIVVQPSGLTANIAQKTVAVTGESATNKTYDGTTAATLTGGSLGGVIAGDSVTLNQAGVFGSKNVGTGIAVTASDSLGSTDAGNYTLTQSTGLAADITAANLIVTGNAASKTYDGAAYSGGNGVAYSGFVNGETDAVLGGVLSYGGSSQGAIDIGDYFISPKGLSSGNYAITYVNGALTIAALPVPTPTPDPVLPQTSTPTPDPVRNVTALLTSHLTPSPGNIQSGTTGQSITTESTQDSDSDQGAPLSNVSKDSMTIGENGPTIVIEDGGVKLPDNI